MLELKHIIKKYQEVILDDVNYCFEDTGLYVIVGQSGCGKTTLLNLIGKLDDDYAGEIVYQNQDIRTIKNYIKKYIGFIFQNFHLLDEYHVQDNYYLPRYFKKIFYKKDVRSLIDKLKIQNLSYKKISQISGGQKQRVALMRSLIGDNQIILCDEPTGSLDQKNSQEVFNLLQHFAQDHLIIVITHDIELAQKYHHVLLSLENGKLIEKSHRKKDCKKHISKKKKYTSYIGIIIKQFRHSLKTNLLIMQVIMISLLCIIVTFSLTNASRIQIKKQLENIIPSSQIIVKKKDQSFLNEDELSQINHPAITYHYLENNQCEMLGIGINNQYELGSTLYIGDCTKDIYENQIIQGRIYHQDDEIVLSQSTYNHLLDVTKQKDLLNHFVKLWYQKETTIQSVDVKVVGISKENTLFDTIYFQEYKNIHDLKRLFNESNHGIGIINLQDSQKLEQLKKQYKQYDFQISNQQLTQSVDQTIDKLELILLCFCSLAIVSSCFLIGEIFYLMVTKKKKMFAVLRSLGASSFQILFSVLIQGLIIVHFAFAGAFFFLSQSVSLINHMIADVFYGLEDFLVLDYSMIFVIYLLSVLLCLISCFLPAHKACQYDIIEGLKG